MSNKNVWQILNNCFKTNEIPTTNIYFEWLNSLDDTESREQYKQLKLQDVFWSKLKIFLDDVEWDKITKNAQGAPVWRMELREFLNWYTDFLIEQWYIRWKKWSYKWVFSDYWIERYKFNVLKYLTDAEQEPKKLGTLLNSFKWWSTHWNLMNSIMSYEFYRMFMSKSEMEKYLWESVEQATFEALWQLYWGNKCIYDFFSDAEKEARPLDKMTVLLYDEKWNEMEYPSEWYITRTYLSNLTIDQQIKQFEASYGKFNMFEKMAFVIKRSFFAVGNFAYKAINWVTSPAIYSTLLSFWWWIKWLVSLLVLNSMGYVSDLFLHHTVIKWDWDKFMKKYWFWTESFSDTLTEWSFLQWLKYLFTKTKQMFQQWLFNAVDVLTENNYRKRVVQDYLSQIFPWCKSLDMIDKELQELKIKDAKKYDDLMLAIKYWIDESLGKQRSQYKLSPLQKEVKPFSVWSPEKDIIKTLYWFFSWWWKGKIIWAIKTILRTMDWQHWKNFAKVYDEMIAKGMSVDEIVAKYNKIQFEDTEVTYLLNKIFYGMLLTKYMMRNFRDPGGSWENQTLFEWYKEFYEFFSAFDPTAAALETLPEYKIISNIINTFAWQLSLWASWLKATEASILTGTKTLFNILTRWLYFPRIGTQVYANVSRDREKEERHWLSYIFSAIQDNCNGFMYYGKETIDNWLDDFYLPRWPNWFLRKIVWLQDSELEYVNEEKTKLKIAKAVNSGEWFTNYVLYNFPFAKQYNMWMIEDSDAQFIDAVNEFRDSYAYHEFINDRLPDDMTNYDYKFIYNLLVSRTKAKKWSIREDLRKEYSYLNDKKEKKYNWDQQTQEDIVSFLMQNWLDEKQSEELIKRFKSADTIYKEEAVRTLAYMEAKTPWSWLQALSYIMQREVFKETYKDVDYDNPPSDKVIDAKREAAIQKITKKYAKYIPLIDKERTYPQIIMEYVKHHWYQLSDFIKGWEWIDTIDDKGNRVDDSYITYQIISPESWFHSNLFDNTFKAQVVVDTYAARWDVNAYKLKNGYWLIYDLSSIRNDDWSLDKDMSKYMLASLNAVYDHIDKMWVDEEEERKLKQWALMFSEPLVRDILRDETLMAHDDIKQVTNDWLTYWYKEFDELNDLATKYAEEQLEDKKKKKRKNYWYWKRYYNRYWYYNSKWLSNRHNSMYDKTYWKDWLNKYKVYDWTPTKYNVDYLSETDYYKIRELMWKLWGWSWGSGWWAWGSKSWRWSWGNGEANIWVSTKRGKAFQFYKMEDPDKPVEYARPWRARFVKKWSWNDPISTTTWKQLMK